MYSNKRCYLARVHGPDWQGFGYLKGVSSLSQETEVVELNELLQIRHNKLDELRTLGIDPFGQKFERSHTASQILQQYESIDREELAQQEVAVSLAGRIMQK